MSLEKNNYLDREVMRLHNEGKIKTAEEGHKWLLANGYNFGSNSEKIKDFQLAEQTDAAFKHEM